MIVGSFDSSFEYVRQLSQKFADRLVQSTVIKGIYSWAHKLEILCLYFSENITHSK